MNAIDSTIFNPTELVLELNTAQSDRAWQQHQHLENAFSRWQSYLNQVVLDVFLPWLKTEEDKTAKALNSAERSDLWQLVNGTAIAIKDAKLVLIPTEAEDRSELRVPQEWIDIPELKADYYLPVQVNVDAGFIRIWGYATHQQLKNGSFNYGDRSYSLSEEELIGDINALWVARELCPDEVTQAAIEPVTELAPARAENLIERLGDRSVVMPRLAVPFAAWAGLLQNPAWCRRLAATRRGETTRTPVLQWLQQGMANLSAELGWRQIELAPSTVGARSAATADLTSVPAFGLAKRLEIQGQPYELKILPLAEADSWRFELCCLTPGCTIPPGFKLRLLTEDLQGFAGNEDVATEPVAQLCLEVDLEPGEALVWQIEPTPTGDRLEVLQF